MMIMFLTIPVKGCRGSSISSLGANNRGCDGFGWDIGHEDFGFEFLWSHVFFEKYFINFVCPINTMYCANELVDNIPENLVTPKKAWGEAACKASALAMEAYN